MEIPNSNVKTKFYTFERLDKFKNIFFLEFGFSHLEFKKKVYICTHLLKQLLFYSPAGMVKLVDTPDLGSGAARCVGSSPITRTKLKRKFGLF